MQWELLLCLYFTQVLKVSSTSIKSGKVKQHGHVAKPQSCFQTIHRYGVTVNEMAA